MSFTGIGAMPPLAAGGVRERMGRNARAIQEIKARLNLVDIARRYVDLKRNGPRWVAPCPFHQETKPLSLIHI